MEKMFLTCERCGYVQAVRGNDGSGGNGNGKRGDKRQQQSQQQQPSPQIWGCARCKRMQVVSMSKKRIDNGRGRRLLTCGECGYRQSVRSGGKDGDNGKQQQSVWVCYACRRPQVLTV